MDIHGCNSITLPDVTDCYYYSIQDIEDQMDRQRPQYQLIHQLASELTSDRKVNDPGTVKHIVRNVDDNWNALIELLQFR